VPFCRNKYSHLRMEKKALENWKGGLVIGFGHSFRPDSPTRNGGFLLSCYGGQ